MTVMRHGNGDKPPNDPLSGWLKRTCRMFHQDQGNNKALAPMMRAQVMSNGSN